MAASAPALGGHRSFCVDKQITGALLLCTSCLHLFLKLLQIIKDALKACRIVYHCRYGLGTTAEGLKQYPISLVPRLVIYLFSHHFLIHVLRNVCFKEHANWSTGSKPSDPRQGWDDANRSDVKCACSPLEIVCSVSDRFTGLYLYSDCM
jgi:hypothetical protein